MLYPRLTNCTNCSDISSLIAEIDCKIAKLAGNIYNNITLMFNQPIPAEAFVDLLTYRRILERKIMNPSYAGSYTVNDIASRVKILKYKK